MLETEICAPTWLSCEHSALPIIWVLPKIDKHDEVKNLAVLNLHESDWLVQATINPSLTLPDVVLVLGA